MAYKITKMPLSWIGYYYRLGKRFYLHSSSAKGEDDLEYLVMKLRVMTHEIDKGLNMRAPKDGFGKQKVQTMLRYLDKYLDINNLDYEYDAYMDAVEILHAYVEAKELYHLDTEFIDLKKYPVDYDKCPSRLMCSRQEKIKDYQELNFKNMAYARHSVREFKAEPVARKKIEKAVRLAQTAPSACNRQSIHILFENNPFIASKMIEIQGGLKGAYNAQNCILVVADLNSYWYAGEMMAAYVDGGLFMMNLLYALTYYGIASCPLIWDDNSYKRQKLNEISELKENYLIVGMIAVGYADEDAKILRFPRKDIENVMLNQEEKK